MWIHVQRNEVVVLTHLRYFFDDKEDNIRPFGDTGFNAMQVSCGSRGLDALLVAMAGLGQVLYTTRSPEHIESHRQL